MLNAIDKKILAEVADLHEIPHGAYNIRKNGEKAGRNTTANIDIITKQDKPGIDIIVKPGTKGESVHIPVILSEGMDDLVYNTFEIGADSDVLIVAGCGIHNPGSKKAQHDGVHEFFVRKGAKMKYVEKHYGEGDGSGERILNPKTIIEVEEGGVAELEMVQIRGVDQTKRDTEVRLHKNARLIVMERLLTTTNQNAESNITVELTGEDAAAQIISRSVAQDHSTQVFHLNMRGYAQCRGHIQCDSIIMDQAKVSSIPEISAFHSDAQLIHEAAIGRIANDQLIKLMTLGLTEKEAEDMILQGFLA
ncbi:MULTISPECIES: SufD family Fe-S cluster assembly protein [Dehalobacter]|jgi:Fe-S cluster assembly scaffold protein SufB|uniref:ABC transporter permease n=2 Tax=Dehalobacter restrictus TaxID=55583 RepID=A0A857DHV1_9FIRM|nr:MULTISPECIES: SufD family Fe-S cluster assembly protein [Dehalobacter]AHF09483.1 SufBD protein [Dehalobacter restrictus DSM 9455]MCG1026029.1 SufD family Fe-S cluster assembly protein [Dehalobacter sp.]MDJ0304786.1 SufD family Fe-S cluster assembly protein [Dehalobacter sp.]OCZ50397.1 ABC transporter permease [Dehalobacter sp. TeCB1]QHA00072.1 ABC transporter permease [Dehalobacter restrictus]